MADCLSQADATQCWGWVVFFAPSAAEFTLPYLHKVFQIRDAYSSTRDSTGKPTIKVAAIGTTTASALRDKLGLQVDVVPKKQASGDLPSGLASAIIAFDSV